MISPEVLRRYPFFCFLDDAAQKAVAMIAVEETYPADVVIFKDGQPARDFYLLTEGCVYLYFTPEANGALHERILVGEINVGEPFGLSALVEPHALNASAIAGGPCRVLKLDGAALLALCAVNHELSAGLMQRVAEALAERLHGTRLQLAAARA